MKVLVLTGNAYLPIKPFNKSKNGFGYTVGAICQHMSKKHDVFLLSQSSFTKEKEFEHIHIVKKTVLDLLQSFSMVYISQWWRETQDISIFTLKKYRVLGYYLTGAYVERIIKKVRPDIVNIKGVHLPTSSFITACKSSNIPYVVSLHGLNSFNDELKQGKTLIKLERDFLMEIHDQPVTVISSGIKRRVEGFVGKSMPSIHVILNGVKNISEGAYKDTDLKKQLNIPEDSFVLISVSSINKNKNQIQVIEAIGMMPDTIKSKIIYLICGVGDYEKELLQKASELGIGNQIKLCGYIEHSNIWRYYSISDLNLMVSHSEGFGRSVIEGYMCGVPAIMYSDLDACEDITNPNTALVLRERSTKALMDGIIKALSKQWNLDEIVEYSKQFTEEKMAENYADFFEAILDGNLEKGKPNEICNQG